MPPFACHQVITGFKERIESILHHADRLYLGTATGNLHVFSITKGSDDTYLPTFEDCKKGLSRRAIEQLGYIKDVNSLVVLADGTVTLYPSPGFTPPTLLTQAKVAMSFGIDTSVQYPSDTPSSPGGPNSDSAVPSVVTRLAVGCRRKIVIYTWKDGEPQEVKELALPHSPRSIVFSTSNILVLSYSATGHILLKLPIMSVTELILPAPPPAPPVPTVGGGYGLGALSGLGGYMTLGLGAKDKPYVYRINDEGEFAITKDNLTAFFSQEGQLSRASGVEWPGPPEETAFVKPYIVSALPPNTVPISLAKPPASGTSAPAAMPPTYSVPTIRIASSLSQKTVQTIPFPFVTAKQTAQSPPPTALRLLQSSPNSKSPMFLTSTPVDKTAAVNEGATIWSFVMEPWGEQIDELVDAGSYADALTLLGTLDATLLPDQDKRKAHIQGLHAVSVFCKGKFGEAVKTFIDLDVNPAKVVALYPEEVSGRLAKPKSSWIELFGGKPTTEVPVEKATPDETQAQGQSTASAIAGQLMGALETIAPAIPDAIPQLRRDDDTRSIHSVNAGKPPVKGREKSKDDYSRSIENLLVYLGDRRPKLSGALQTFGITPARSHEFPALSETSVEELFALPNQAIPSLTPQQLLRYAQIVDTALFKSYLVIRPSLIGSLCRLDNWCEVTEVEEVLRDRKKFSELIDLYKGKKMHDKALALLKELGEDEDDLMDKLDPTIQYLQRLGPQFKELIFSWSKWVLDVSLDRGLNIFTSEEAELPRKDVAAYLANRDLPLCAKYIEFLMDERHEEGELFHNWLAEIYLDLAGQYKRNGDQAKQGQVYRQLLEFLDTSVHYDTERIFARLPSDDLFEARAILLGRLEKHEAALDIYVNRLHNHEAAENWCKRVYQTNPDPKGIFLTLLRIYLRPAGPDDARAYLGPALDLISRHSPRLDSIEALQLLPPLVNASDLRSFLIEALKSPKVDTRITREILKSCSFQIDRKLMALQSRRVRITDTRICPQCHKRLGNSVVAVHAPRGEVTHYQCREAFIKKINPDNASVRKFTGAS